MIHSLHSFPSIIKSPTVTRIASHLTSSIRRTFSIMAPNHQAVYIVSAIHCPAPDGINPHCYSITGAYATAERAHAAMLAKAKELYTQPVTHWHGIPKKGTPEWK